MRIFGTGTFAWWQLGIFKLSLLSLGIAIGARWAELFIPYLETLIMVGLAAGVYVAYAWMTSGEEREQTDTTDTTDTTNKTDSSVE